jgi:hypothetical protein
MKVLDDMATWHLRLSGLLSTPHKMLFNILFSRLHPYVDETTGDHLCAFQNNKSTTWQIFCIQSHIGEKKYHDKGHQPFIDFKKAYDSVRKEVLYNILI